MQCIYISLNLSYNWDTVKMVYHYPECICCSSLGTALSILANYFIFCYFNICQFMFSVSVGVEKVIYDFILLGVWQLIYIRLRPGREADNPATQNRGLKSILNKNTQESGLASWEVIARLAATRMMFKYKFNVDNLEEHRLVTRLHFGPIFKLDKLNMESYIYKLSLL